MKLIFLTALEDICSCFKPKITSGWYIFYFISLLSWFTSVLIFRYLYWKSRQKSRGWKWLFSSVLCEKRNCVSERFLSNGRTEKVISVSAPSNLKWSAASQKSKACGEGIQSVAFTRSRTCCTDDRSLGWDRTSYGCHRVSPSSPPSVHLLSVWSPLFSGQTAHPHGQNWTSVCVYSSSTSSSRRWRPAAESHTPQPSRWSEPRSSPSKHPSAPERVYTPTPEESHTTPDNPCSCCSSGTTNTRHWRGTSHRKSLFCMVCEQVEEL